MRYLIVLIACALMSGCAGAGLLAGSSGSTAATASTAATTVSTLPSPSVFDYAGKSKIKLAFVNPAALRDGSNWTYAKIVEEQCAFSNPDPPFFIPNENMTGGWTFAGRLNKDDTFQVLTYKNILTLGLMEGTAQLGTWPVKLITLSDFPQEYLDERLAFVDASKLDSSEQHELVSKYMADSEQLEARVAQLERAYDPQENCPRDPKAKK